MTQQIVRTTEEIVPNPARTIESLRNIGYDMPRAIADLVDNSIAAKATKIDIMIKFKGPDSWIRIADNGHGMDTDTLHEALRYGTDRRYNTDDLGRFGFGLKTSSTSQCRRMTVASRQTANGSIVMRCLDLEHIAETNRWEALIPQGSARPMQVVEPLKDRRGTVILWESLDRVLNYRDPFGEHVKKKLKQIAQDTDEHLAMVFHRFISGEVSDEPLAITINKRLVQPWDPFCRNESSTSVLKSEMLPVTSDGGNGIVRVTPYILPSKKDFSSLEAWRKASGPAKWNKQQGHYIYRANRLIQSGGWNRFRGEDEHLKLARIAVDFFPDLDSAFGINIAKASVQIPSDIREELKRIGSSVGSEAKIRYDDKTHKAQSKRNTWSKEHKYQHPLPQNRKSTQKSPDSDGYTTESSKPRVAIEHAALTVGETAALEKIIEALKNQKPKVAHDLGW